MLRSIGLGNQLSQSGRRKEGEGFAEKEGFKLGTKSERAMGDESGE